jgi:hypothetical protein
MRRCISQGWQNPPGHDLGALSKFRRAHRLQSRQAYRVLARNLNNCLPYSNIGWTRSGMSGCSPTFVDSRKCALGLRGERDPSPTRLWSNLVHVVEKALCFNCAALCTFSGTDAVGAASLGFCSGSCTNYGRFCSLMFNARAKGNTKILLLTCRLQSCRCRRQERAAA